MSPAAGINARMTVRPNESARLLQETDWTKTALGPMEQWPQSLRLALGICLNSRFPMMLWWGPGLVNIYNDAYSLMLGKRHPSAFGRPAQEVWEEIWPIIEPQARAVMQRGEASWNENVLLVLERNGYPEEAWFTWSYSPIIDESGAVAGLFNACTEDTARVLAERQRDQLIKTLESEGARLAETFGQSPAFLAVLRGPEHVFESVNDRYLEMLGGRELIGKTIRAAMPELHGQGYFELLDQVYSSGEAFHGTAQSVLLRRQPAGDLDEVFLDFSYQPMRGLDGAIIGLLAHGVDVTERVRVERTLHESEARFRNLSDHAPVMIWVTRPDGEFEYVNALWQRFTGQGGDDASGLGWLATVHPEDARRASDVFLAANDAREAFELEYRLRRKDGEYRWCVGSASPRIGEGGEFLGYIGTVLDIDDRRRGEMALASKRAVLEMIATGSPMPAVLDSIVRNFEAQSTDAMLCSVMLLDESDRFLLHGAAPGLPEAFNRAIAGLAVGPLATSCGAAVHERRTVYTTDIASDRRWRDYRALADEHGLRSCSCTPIIGGDGRVLGMVAMYYRQARSPSVHDLELARGATYLAGIVAEKHQLDQRLRHALEAEQDARALAERSGRMKDEFLATLSHELRTPMSAILGWAQIMKTPSLSAEDMAQGLEVIERNARAQAKIIEDLLDMSAIISGKVRLNRQPVDLAAIVREAVETARPTADAKQIDLLADIPALAGLVIIGDSSRLQQILWNLIGNAVKFTPKDGRISIQVEHLDASVRISVRDTGAGIKPEFLPFVFDRFRQADASITRQFGGLGLGLSIVKQLVEIHGGTVGVSSPGLGLGASFVFTLPLAPITRPAAMDPADAGRRPLEDPDSIAGLRVLVVDDDADARNLVKRILEDGQAQVTGACSAAEALDLLRSRGFDVLVSDIGMPGEDGHSLLRRLRARGFEAGGNLPAIALTAYARPEDREDSARVGYQTHLAKPVDALELTAAVAALRQR